MARDFAVKSRNAGVGAGVSARLLDTPEQRNKRPWDYPAGYSAPNRKGEVSLSIISWFRRDKHTQELSHEREQTRLERGKVAAKLMELDLSRHYLDQFIANVQIRLHEEKDR